MTAIFMPLNDIREKIIIENAHLIVEEQMPQCLLEFVTHVVGYKALLANGPTETTQNAAPPSAGLPNSIATLSAPTPPSRPNRPACCTTISGGSITGRLTARSGK